MQNADLWRVWSCFSFSLLLAFCKNPNTINGQIRQPCTPETPASLSKTIGLTAKTKTLWERGDIEEHVHLNFILVVSTMWSQEPCQKAGPSVLLIRCWVKAIIEVNGQISGTGQLLGQAALTACICVTPKLPQCDRQYFSYILSFKLCMWSDNCGISFNSSPL